MYTICVAAHKGGVGKTTIAANLASALASSEGAVLAVDLDPQGGLSGAFGADGGKPTVYEVLRGRGGCEATAPKAVQRSHQRFCLERVTGIEPA